MVIRPTAARGWSYHPDSVGDTQARIKMVCHPTQMKELLPSLAVEAWVEDCFSAVVHTQITTPDSSIYQ